MPIICLDTQLIQWGVLQHAGKATQNYVAAATGFIRWLDQQRVDIIIPSIIVGELLAPVPRSEHNQILSRLSQDWLIVDYDLRAARLFAEMRYDTDIKRLIDDIRRGDPYATRKHLVADIMIIATARAHNAERIYSHDGNFLKLCSSYILAENFLNVPFQRNQPEDE